jgi:hypothetical protein
VVAKRCHALVDGGGLDMMGKKLMFLFQVLHYYMYSWIARPPEFPQPALKFEPSTP